MNRSIAKNNQAGDTGTAAYRLQFLGLMVLLVTGMKTGNCGSTNVIGMNTGMYRPTNGVDLVTNYCPEAYIQHWDTLVFTLSTDTVDNHKGRPPLHGETEYDVKVLRESHSVGDLRKLVADKLNRLGYSVAGKPVSVKHIGELVHAHSSIICAIPSNIRLPGSR